ncbi:hypothetical protein, partial [Bacteroides heparinolyticus]|uniref:hypothetical protein n=1 Tax=Prevotella heparinolytica TaxID=28113 RepID=UPI00359F6A6C
NVHSLYECAESTPVCRKNTIERNGAYLFEPLLKKRKIKKKRRSRESFGETNLKKCDFIEEPDIAFSCVFFYVFWSFWANFAHKSEILETYEE